MNDFIEDVGTVVMLFAWIAQVATPFALVGFAMWVVL